MKVIYSSVPRTCSRLLHRSLQNFVVNMDVAKTQMPAPKLKPKVFCLINAEKDEYQNYLNVAKDSLLQDKIIGVPTDTIYGVAASAQSSVGVRKLYEVKQRNSSNPVAISVADVDEIYKWGVVTVSRSLLTDLLPGPVTLVFERTRDLNPELNPQTHLIGMRIPNHPFIRDLAQTCGVPIALTSANISSQPSSISAEEFRHLWPHLDLVFTDDSKTDSSRLGSTVVDLSQKGHYHIIRAGSALEPTKRILHKHNLTEIGSQR